VGWGFRGRGLWGRERGWSGRSPAGCSYVPLGLGGSPWVSLGLPRSPWVSLGLPGSREGSLGGTVGSYGTVPLCPVHPACPDHTDSQCAFGRQALDAMSSVYFPAPQEVCRRFISSLLVWFLQALCSLPANHHEHRGYPEPPHGLESRWPPHWVPHISAEPPLQLDAGRLVYHIDISAMKDLFCCSSHSW